MSGVAVNFSDRAVFGPAASRARAAANGGWDLTPMAELLALTPEAILWLWQDRLPAGTVSMAVGKPKAGKGTFARNLAFRVARGEPFLGSATTRGEVVYLALEETPGDVRNDFAAMGASGNDPILVHAAAAPDDALGGLVETVRRRRPALVVVDPLVRLARFRDEKAYAEVYAAVGPLVDLARETGTHILVLHHCGKIAHAEAIDAPLGSTALGGLVSTLAVIRRNDRRRTVETVQRRGADLEETVLAWDAETRLLSAAGTKDQADQEEAAKAILELLQSVGPQTQAQIREAIPGRTSAVRLALTGLANAGQVCREGKGTRGEPFQFGLPDSGSLVPDLSLNSGNQKPTAAPCDVTGGEIEKASFWFPYSKGMSGTRKPETDEGTETRLNSGRILVPAVSETGRCGRAAGNQKPQQVARNEMEL